MFAAGTLAGLLSRWAPLSGWAALAFPLVVPPAGLGLTVLVCSGQLLSSKPQRLRRQVPRLLSPRRPRQEARLPECGQWGLVDLGDTRKVRAHLLRVLIIQQVGDVDRHRLRPPGAEALVDQIQQRE